jgi:F0F1-type ATP synthase membrane subunit b/b'
MATKTKEPKQVEPTIEDQIAESQRLETTLQGDYADTMAQLADNPIDSKLAQLATTIKQQLAAVATRIQQLLSSQIERDKQAVIDDLKAHAKRYAVWMDEAEILQDKILARQAELAALNDEMRLKKEHRQLLSGRLWNARDRLTKDYGLTVKQASDIELKARGATKKRKYPELS